jgi:Zn finger protein HypA/HybF involved in hydrogenase expression
MTDLSSRTAIEIEEAKEKEDLKKIEAILFVSGRFLSMQEIDISFRFESINNKGIY